MAIFANVFLLTILCCFSVAAAAREKIKVEEQLASQMCHNTTNFNFCRQTVYSDERAPTADRFVLAYIVFGNAYLNATNIQAQIQLKIKENGEGDHVLDGLMRCMGYYTDAIGDMAEVLSSLDSDSYHNFGKLSTEAQGRARSCENGLNRSSSSLMTKENVDFIKLTDICYAVAKLFPHTD